jgi:predicted RNA-binding protein Jag
MPAQPKEIVEKILTSLGFQATVEEHKLDDGFLLDVKTDDSGRLIGRQGQTLADLQYITNRILFQQDPRPRRKSRWMSAATARRRARRW